MPAYSFIALDSQGKTCKGTLEADSARSARSLIRAQALVPLHVDALGSPGADAGAPGSGRRRTRAFGSTALAIWTRQLAGLVRAGLPLERALGALADESDSEARRNLNAALRADVNAGSDFGTALARYPQEFARVYVAVVAAGEQSGDLGLVLERLADDLEERQVLQSKLLGAALYPLIVSLVALCIVLFLMTYVVPQVATVFTGTRHSLPFLTLALLAISDFVRSYGWMLALLLLGAGMALRLALRSAALRLRFDAAWLTLPLVGRLSRDYNAARFASTLALLSAAGVPILRALQAGSETLNNSALRRDALDALALVREGAPLAAALAQKKRFPGLLSMFVRLGEQTGQLPEMLERVARQLGNAVQRRAMALATVLEPLLIVFMGLVVMLIVLAVLLPIIELNQWVR